MGKPTGFIEFKRKTIPYLEPLKRLRTFDEFVEKVRRALYASKIVAYSQGFDEINAGAAEYGWDIDRGALATIWRGGCIIRARFLNRIKEAYDRNPELPALLLDPYFRDQVSECLDAWRDVVVTATRTAITADWASNGPSPDSSGSAATTEPSTKVTACSAIMMPVGSISPRASMAAPTASG